MRSVKKTVILFLMILFLSGAAACGEDGNGPSPAAPDNRGETAYILFYDSSANFEVTGKIIDTFNKSGGNTIVSVNYLQEGQYDESIQRLLSAGDTSADCMFISQPGQTNEYGHEGYLVDLNLYLSQSQLDIANYDSTAEIVSADGIIYGLPRARTAWLLFYNKGLFDNKGLAYPEQLTWEEYAELAKELTVDSERWREKVWGGYLPADAMNLGASSAGEYLTDDELPLTMRYVEFMNRVYNTDETHLNLSTTNVRLKNYYLHTYFEDGRLAMMVGPDSTIQTIQNDAKTKNFELDWDIAPLPVFSTGDAGTTVGGCSYIGISSYSDSPERAFEFISYYCGEQGSDILAEYAVCPAYFTEASTEIYLDNAQKDGAKYFFESNILIEEGAHIKYHEVEEAFAAEMQGYFSGTAGLQQAFESFYDRRLAILQP